MIESFSWFDHTWFGGSSNLMLELESAEDLTSKEK